MCMCVCIIIETQTQVFNNKNSILKYFCFVCMYACEYTVQMAYTYTVSLALSRADPAGSPPWGSSRFLCSCMSRLLIYCVRFSVQFVAFSPTHLYFSSVFISFYLQLLFLLWLQFVVVHVIILLLLHC